MLVLLCVLAGCSTKNGPTEVAVPEGSPTQPLPSDVLLPKDPMPDAAEETPKWSTKSVVWLTPKEKAEVWNIFSRADASHGWKNRTWQLVRRNGDLPEDWYPVLLRIHGQQAYGTAAGRLVYHSIPFSADGEKFQFEKIGNPDSRMGTTFASTLIPNLNKIEQQTLIAKPSETGVIEATWILRGEGVELEWVDFKNGDPAEQDADLLDRTWVLVDFNENAPEVAGTTLVLNGDQARFNTGCMQGLGSFRWKGNPHHPPKPEFGAMDLTGTGCSASAKDFAQELADALPLVKGGAMHGWYLFLWGENTSLSFTTPPPKSYGTQVGEGILKLHAEPEAP